MASLLGAGMCADALLVALRLANTFRRIFAEGAFNASFLPRFSKILNQDGQEEANVVLADIFWTLLLATSIFSAIVLMFFPSILSIIVSGFDILSAKFQLTVELGRICFPYLILISLSSLFAGVLNSVDRFAMSAAVHSLMSLFTITGLICGYFYDLSQVATVRLLSWVVLLSGGAQLCALYISARNYGFRLALRWSLSQQVKDVMKNMIPGIVGAGVWQLNILVDTIISSHFPTGSITCINLADRLVQFPLGTLGIAFSTALLPTLSKHICLREYDKASEVLRDGILTASFFSLLATSVLLALDRQTVAVAFQRGLFQQEQVRVTADVLVGLSIGLPAFMLTKILSSMYFAVGDTKTPVIFGVCSVVINVICIGLFVPFKKYLGIALGTSLSAMANAFLLLRFSPEHIKIEVNKNFVTKISTQLCAAIIVYFLLDKLSNIFWTPEIGNLEIKWFVYAGFAAAAVAVFVIITFLEQLFNYLATLFNIAKNN
jgi:putative peptidoglycan lipid II flippase